MIQVTSKARHHRSFLNHMFCFVNVVTSVVLHKKLVQWTDEKTTETLLGTMVTHWLACLPASSVVTCLSPHEVGFILQIDLGSQVDPA